MPSLPVIAITVGEPAGIGPEVALRAAWEERNQSCFVLIGDFNLLHKKALRIDPDIVLKVLPADAPDQARVLQDKNTLLVLDCPLEKPVEPGYPDSANAQSVLQTLDLAIDGAMGAYFDAIVTAPVQKSVMNRSGAPFTGHTEYIAQKTHTPHVVMLLAGNLEAQPSLASRALRVALATVHLPLKNVSFAITQPSLTKTIAVLHSELQVKLGIASPRILVSGLNPHAGENGFLGQEEEEVIRPVILAMQQKGMRIEGPFPADTLFLPRHIAEADCFLVMYHDQGLPVLKYATFGHGVNITLGLPIIRTSTDHGTALDVAMKGVGFADYGSMREAIRVAVSLIKQNGKHQVL